MKNIHHFSIFKINPFWIQLFYFLAFSLFGYLALQLSVFRSSSSSTFKPKNLDIFFTSMSSITLSSMSTIEMEVFSNTQFIILTVLILIGGEVFISMIGLHFSPYFQKTHNNDSKKSTNQCFMNSNNLIMDQIEMGLVTSPSSKSNLENCDQKQNSKVLEQEHSKNLKCKSMKYLSCIVFCYFLVIHICGSILVLIYMTTIGNATDLLKKKGIGIKIFSIFTTVSSFSNCGFLPVNENMIVFKENSGMLLLIIAQILLGNTLYPCGLRLVIWFLKKISKRVEFTYILSRYDEMGYSHLFSCYRCCMLAVTTLGLVLVQFIVFCCMEWNSEALHGLSLYQKVIGMLFQVVNSRHAGESVLDLSVISPVVLVLFLLMMYLPPSVTFMPLKDEERVNKSKIKKRERMSILDTVILSQLSYLVICIILVCFMERNQMKEDPFNFNLLTITLEVISAYGNVGFSTGYSCKRRLKIESSCEDKWYGFAGKWSNGGKFILILVMLFGRLKKFNSKGGKAWKLF